jgi:hypothetical protein
MKCKKLGSNELLIAGSTYDKEECGFPTGLIVTDKKLQKGTHFYRYIGKEGKKASRGELEKKEGKI